MILSKSLKHGWYYYYKVHQEKLERLSNKGYESLSSYLLAVRQQENRPDHLFTDGPRSSQTDIDLDVSLHETTHIVSDLASMGLESDYYKDNHMNVQMFMLAYDKETVAMEIPVWFDEETFPTSSENRLTGHIDLLRIEGDTVWVWDYKPKAHLEDQATTQVFLYAWMLSQRAGINLENMSCGYFDEYKAYTFDPVTARNALTDHSDIRSSNDSPAISAFSSETT